MLPQLHNPRTARRHDCRASPRWRPPNTLTGRSLSRFGLRSTGPMFVKYNAVLRGRHSDVPFLRNTLVSLCCAADVAADYLGGAKTHETAKGGLPFEAALALSNGYVTTLVAARAWERAGPEHLTRPRRY